jgi:DNA-binding FadR family transcriptional regulator
VIGVTKTLSDASFDRLKRPARLADQIYQHLLEQIVEGTLVIGQRLPSEVQLCEVFGVSRPVIRETISRLQADALVATRKGSGTVVLRRPDRAVLTLAPSGEIADLMRCFEFRIAVEGEAAYLAAQRRTADDVDEIESALANLDRVIEREEVGVEADFRFHVSIARATKNNFFIEQLNSLSGYVRNGMNLTRRLSLARKRRRQALVQNEHREITRSVLNQDEEAARSAMRIHIDNARKRALDDSIEPA